LERYAPKDGKSKCITPYMEAVKVDYNDLLARGATVAVYKDAWAPRSGFLFGRVEGLPGDLAASPGRWVPLAQNFQATPNHLVSADPNDLNSETKTWFEKVIDKWPLTPIAESGKDERLSTLVLVMMTKTNKVYNTETDGPIEFNVFAKADVPVPRGATPAPVPVLMYHTVLPVLGFQKPGEAGKDDGDGTYFIRMPIDEVGEGFLPSRLLSAQIVNRSDDAWCPEEIWLFGLNTDGSRGRLFVHRTLGGD